MVDKLASLQLHAEQVANELSDSMGDALDAINELIMASGNVLNYTVGDEARHNVQWSTDIMVATFDDLCLEEGVVDMVWEGVVY